MRTAKWTVVKALSYFVFCISLLPAALASSQQAYDSSVFLKRHCIQCHGPQKQKGDRRFDSIENDFSSDETARMWQEIVDVVNRGEMPPKDQAKPPVSETKRFVADITRRLALARKAHVAGEQVSYRRLNRYEYRNTVRDLCGVNIQSFDPTSSFPADARVDGFENIGKELVLSDFLLKCYLDAAEQVLDKAWQSPPEATLVREVFTPNDMCSRKFHFRPQINFQVNVNGRYVDVGHGDRFSDRVHAQRFKGVPQDGFYIIRVKAEAINRKHPYDQKLLGIAPDEPIKMEVLVADPRVGGRLSGNRTDRSVAIVPLRDHQAKVYEFRTWMDKGYIPLVRYINGPQPIKRVLFRIAPKYHAEALPSNWRSGTDRQPAERKKKYLSDVYLGPRMRIHRMELEGPQPVASGDGSRATLLGQRGRNASNLDSENALQSFLFRAFRRPPRKSELARYRSFLHARLASGESPDAALQTTFKAILCSPHFLYLETPRDRTNAKLIQYRMASRISYFLWSSMPDEKLFQAASNGELTDPKRIVTQVNRMLDAPKAWALSKRFTDSWLRLNQLGTMPPDAQKFPSFHRRMLQPMMKQETQRFFEHILKNNLSIMLFVDADFTFLNRYMAEHYGISNIVGDHFRKVSLPPNSQRGGLLGHASVLTTTSNGVETSPVTRGIWVLENILGTPPSPPPADVEPLEPDIRGATTIRQQLAKHRNIATCAECHKKIDPIGFALECFDPIGSFRFTYRRTRGKPGKRVDTSGTLPSGESFKNIAELKNVLMGRKKQFARCLTEKMLTYALGRELTFRDRPQVDDIVAKLASRGYGLRDLVELIVSSEVFRKD